MASTITVTAVTYLCRLLTRRTGRLRARFSSWRCCLYVRAIGQVYMPTEWYIQYG